MAGEITMTKNEARIVFAKLGYTDIRYSGKKRLFYVTRLGIRISIAI